MTNTSHAVAEKICVSGNDVEAKEDGKSKNKNIFNGRLTVLFNERCHNLMVA
jgi:hypothetical protein